MLFNKTVNTSSDSSINKLLFIISTILFIMLSPYFVWSNQLVILRISHLIGNTIILYIILKHQNNKISNFGLGLFFLIIAIYTMIAAPNTTNSRIYLY